MHTSCRAQFGIAREGVLCASIQIIAGDGAIYTWFAQFTRFDNAVSTLLRALAAFAAVAARSARVTVWVAFACAGVDAVSRTALGVSN
jgi:hypothetical protein